MVSAITENDSDNPDIEMINTQIENLITERLMNSRWAVESTQATLSTCEEYTKPLSAASPNVIVVPETNGRKILKPVQPQKIPTLKQTKISPVITQPESESWPNIPTSSSDKAPSKEHLSELLTSSEAEERRDAQAAANTAICTAAINGEQNALGAISGQNKQFADSLLVYIRAAVFS